MSRFQKVRIWVTWNETAESQRQKKKFQENNDWTAQEGSVLKKTKKFTWLLGSC